MKEEGSNLPRGTIDLFLVADTQPRVETMILSLREETIIQDLEAKATKENKGRARAERKRELKLLLK